MVIEARNENGAKWEHGWGISRNNKFLLDSVYLTRVPECLAVQQRKVEKVDCEKKGKVKKYGIRVRCDALTQGWKTD